MKTILCAVDFSKFSQPVIDCAAGLAQGFAVPVAVFHALNVSRTPLPPDAVATPDTDEAGQVQTVRTRVAHLVGDRQIDWHVVIRRGNPVEAIEAYTRDHEVGMVVAASYGLSGLQRFLGGTIVEALARRLPTPLLVVRTRRTGKQQPASTAHGFSMQNILVGCDLTAASDTLFACSAVFARCFGSRLHFAHTVEAPIAADHGDATTGSYTEAQQGLKDDLHERLILRLPEGIRRDGRFEADVLEGNPADTLRDYAAATAVDLIIIGVRPRRGFQKLLIGSTTESLLRHAPCNVLAVPYGAGG
jgi:nucleotide-binding universal stress UspA family protein